MYIFWCQLPDGRQLSVSTNNLHEAPRRARALGAVRLFGNHGRGTPTFELSL